MRRGIVGEGDVRQVLIPVVRVWRFADLRQRVENCSVQILSLPITAWIELRSVDVVHAERLGLASRQVRRKLCSSVGEDMAREAHSQHIGHE